eukprot:Plantae.Rhodophyta-Purpureofilum_apyrenoidigerum.ctg1604.p3 GENE.Plantae.Rhodophyta-Purpureofilum_apyrenoidigerum.ctg1604~~Plantae.Rhodophyta-Purpureofilum_apyrenoidigerum.ctg1604.p3  ORF type:complete len:214 (-),score=38.63 Plantae.Rhodophyta-Purpureofilum_apyrenoidigerum.ctg1604:1583-2224(-)
MSAIGDACKGAQGLDMEEEGLKVEAEAQSGSSQGSEMDDAGVDTTGEDIVLPYQPVKHLDLDRYLGRWFEVASIPNRWQTRGKLSTVTYARNPKTQKIRIISRTFVDSRRVEQSGRLWVLDREHNSSYKVQFCWPFTGLFWILQVGEKENYGYSVVGDPSKTNLWILSRTPRMEDFIYEKLVAQLEWQGYDVNKIQRTAQSDDIAEYGEDADA